MSTCHASSTFTRVSRLYISSPNIFLWAKYYDERKPIDKPVLKLSHLGEMSISTVFSVVTTNNIAHVILF